MDEKWFYLMRDKHLTFMSCLNMIIEHLGDNDYKIPHMNKAKMEWEGRLHTVIDVMEAAAPMMEWMRAKMSGDDDVLENTNTKT